MSDSDSSPMHAHQSDADSDSSDSNSSGKSTGATCVPWRPSVECSGQYLGSGFALVRFTISDCDGIARCELGYVIGKSGKEMIVRMSLLKDEQLLIRVPQAMDDYKCILLFRFVCINEDRKAAMWVSCDPICLDIPFNFSLHQFAVGDEVMFIPSDEENAFGCNGRITDIEPSSRMACVLSDEQTFNVCLDSLKCHPRHRHKLLNLTDWMALGKTTMFQSENDDICEVFAVVNASLCDSIQEWCSWERGEEPSPLALSLLDLIYEGDKDQDIECCSRFIAYNVVQFLEDPCACGSDDSLSLRCVLCSTKHCNRISIQLRNFWTYKLQSRHKYIRRTGKPLRLPIARSYLCDVCMMNFHSLDYLYVCSSDLEHQHDICMSCMNRNVLEYRQLRNTLEECRDIHQLDVFCVSQILDYVIGWVCLT